MKPLILLLAVALAGCVESQAQAPRMFTQLSGEYPLYVFRDNDTGCQYLWTNDSRGAITPRLDATGKPMCGGAR